MTITMIDTRTAKQPADLVVSQINGLLFGLSGRQDLNLRPLDPQGPHNGDRVRSAPMDRHVRGMVAP